MEIFQVFRFHFSSDKHEIQTTDARNKNRKKKQLEIARILRGAKGTLDLFMIIYETS